MSKDTLELIRDIKFRRMPPEYKLVANKLKNVIPFQNTERSVYYKDGDEIILEVYNSGSDNKSYIKIFYSDKIWFPLYKTLARTPNVIALLKQVTMDILGIKCSSLGWKKQEINGYFYKI